LQQNSFKYLWKKRKIRRCHEQGSLRSSERNLVHISSLPLLSRVYTIYCPEVCVALRQEGGKSIKAQLPRVGMRSRRRVNDAAYFSPDFLSRGVHWEVDLAFNPDIRAAFQILRCGNARGVYRTNSVTATRNGCITEQSQRKSRDIHCLRCANKS